MTTRMRLSGLRRRMMKLSKIFLAVTITAVWLGGVMLGFALRGGETLCP